MYTYPAHLNLPWHQIAGLHPNTITFTYRATAQEWDFDFVEIYELVAQLIWL